MLLPRRTLERLLAGEIDLAFRRWPRARVRAGTRLKRLGRELVVVAVDVVSEKAVDARAARRAGYASRAELLADLDAHGSGSIHRVRFEPGGADPRIALRERGSLSPDERGELERRLGRMDAASPTGAWTAAALAAIRARPGVRAGDLAAALGRERLAFKANVRKLKALGLTESLEVGYRLAPRGEALLRARTRDGGAGRRGASG